MSQSLKIIRDICTHEGFRRLVLAPIYFRGKRLLLRGRKPVSFSGTQGFFVFQSPTELDRINDFGATGSNETEFLKKYLDAASKASVTYDIGANIGIFTVLAALRCKPGAVIHSFEPEANNFTALNENIKLNRLTNVVTHKMALGDRSGTQKLASTSFERGVGTHMIGGVGDVCVDVEANSIDNLVAKGSLPAPDVLKIDVEAYEFHVLVGLARTAATKPLLIFLEFHEQFLHSKGKTREDLRNLVRSLGLDFIEILESANRSQTHLIIGKI